jgi:hypothetical protein
MSSWRQEEQWPEWPHGIHLRSKHMSTREHTGGPLPMHQAGAQLRGHRRPPAVTPDGESRGNSARTCHAGTPVHRLPHTALHAGVAQRWRLRRLLLLLLLLRRRRRGLLLRRRRGLLLRRRLGRVQHDGRRRRRGERCAERRHGRLLGQLQWRLH